MNDIESLTHINYLTVILGIFTILIAVKYIIELFSYFKKKFGIKTCIETEKDDIETRIKKLEKHDNWQYNELEKISDSIDQINKNFVDKEINDLRWELLDFCSALTNGRKYNREAFEHIFRTYENYEKILKDNNMTNGYVEESMQVVREIYHEKLVNGEFKI